MIYPQIINLFKTDSNHTKPLLKVFLCEMKNYMKETAFFAVKIYVCMYFKQTQLLSCAKKMSMKFSQRKIFTTNA